MRRLSAGSLETRELVERVSRLTADSRSLHAHVEPVGMAMDVKKTMGDQSARAPGRVGRETSLPEPKAAKTSSDVGRTSGEAPGGDARAHPLSEASRPGEPDDGK